MPSVHAALTVAVLAGVLALASTAGSTALVGAVALVIVFFAVGAVATTGTTSARWMAALALASGGGALAWTYAERSADLAPMAAVLGPSLVLAIIVQLWRRDGRVGLTSSLAVSVASCVAAVLPVCWVALRESADGVYSVGLALLGVGAVGLVEAIPVSRGARRVVGVLLGAVAAGAVVMTVERIGEAVPPVSAVVVTAFSGLMAAIAFAAVDRLADDAVAASRRVGARSEHERVGQRAAHRIGGSGVGAESAARSAESAGMAEPDSMSEPAGEPDDAPVGAPAGVRGAGALLAMRVTLPFVASAPAAFVLGRIFVG